MINNHTKQKYFKVIFFVVITLWFCLWAGHISMDLTSASSGPDERMRLLVPSYIYHHHALPSGYNPEVAYDIGNWSYAFYPQLLGPIVSSVFMTVVSVFSNMDSSLLFGARLGSVFFGLMTVYVLGLTISKLLDGHKHASFYTYLGMTLLAFWPQFAFLSGYVNNDIVALLGASLILYASVLGYKDGWTYKNAVVLGSGFTVCLLGYTSSWGFIIGGFLFLLIVTFKRKLSRNTLLPFIVACFIPIIVAGPFFIRNALIYNGDFLGVKTFRERTYLWEDQHHIKLQKPYLESGHNLAEIFSDQTYWSTLQDSFIGKFGYMNISPDNRLLIIYKIVLVFSGVGFAVILAQIIRKHSRKQPKHSLALMYSLAISSLVTLAVNLYYTLEIDTQPQGRYIIYILLPLLVASLIGLKRLVELVVPARYRTPLLLAFTLTYVADGLVIFIRYM